MNTSADCQTPAGANRDPFREQWEKEYKGVTDNGKKLPIEQVIPGVFVKGIPVGYMDNPTKMDPEEIWKWHWSST